MGRANAFAAHFSEIEDPRRSGCTHCHDLVEVPKNKVCAVFSGVEGAPVFGAFSRALWSAGCLTRPETLMSCSRPGRRAFARLNATPPAENPHMVRQACPEPVDGLITNGFSCWRGLDIAAAQEDGRPT